MDQVRHFALIVLMAAAVGVVAVLSNRLTQRLRIPVPVLVLVAAAIAVKVLPGLHAPPVRTVEEILTIALIYILFDGGMHIGLRRFKGAAIPVSLLGIAGTFLTAAGGALLLHYGFGLAWYIAVLVATAIAPTDPAVVFSVLGQREIGGRTGTILEGESGANDPVGIALMASLLTAGALDAHAVGSVALDFVVQLVVGAVVGIVGGRAVLWFIRRVALPAEGLYPVRTLACAALLYGLATVAHGSGFLAVFIAGIVLGDERAPYKREVERFHAAVASLAEIVAFVVLGLTLDLDVIRRANVLVPGLVLAVIVAFVVRPLVAGPCLVGSRLTRNESAFVMFAGLKGAVPLLLGELLLGAHTAHAARLYGIVVVVVIFSVLIQGTLTPVVANVLRIPMRPIAPEPWALGVRLRDEPQGAHRYTVAAGASADGRTIADLHELPDAAWISFIIRDGALVMVSRDTQLRAGDELLVLGDDDSAGQLREIFEQPDQRTL